MFRDLHTRLLLSVVILFLGGCSSQSETVLEQVMERGELRIATRNTDTTYYEGPHGPTGIEYHLAKGFADTLGVKLTMLPAANVGEVLEWVTSSKVDFAAAGLTVTEHRKQQVRFSPSYQTITPQLIYRIGTHRPDSLDDLDGHLEVIARSSHHELLESLKPEYPSLTWSINRNAESEELVNLLSEGVIDYTVTDSNEFLLSQHFHPELRVALELSEPQSLAWAFPPGDDLSLYELASNYIEQIRDSGELALLLDRHYGHLSEFDYVGTRTYMRHIQSRLPQYRTLFEKSAEETEIDWRLLAAVAYQESHWDPAAISPTGVRGIMMLTQAAAKDMGIKKRTDASQSIDGGSRYLSMLIKKIPNRIPIPDRHWLALAAYNIGFLHLEDARILTERRGGNPDVWADVRENLPLLRQRKWYKTVRRGYARGNEAVQYVENIRSYYQILVWITEQERVPEPEPPAALEINTPAL